MEQGNDFLQDERLRCAFRLRQQKEIDRVFKSGSVFANELFRAFFLPNQHPYSRLAVSVPKKLCNAVYRHRWKRLLYESFRLNKSVVGVGLDILIVPCLTPQGLKRQDVEAHFISLIQRYRQRELLSLENKGRVEQSHNNEQK